MLRKVSQQEIEKAIQGATRSIEVEGIVVDKKTEELTRKLLNHEITEEEFKNLVIED
jgi:hypothetical protein